MTQFEVLGRRAVAARRWRWLPGTLAVVPPARDGSTGYLNRITEGTGPVNSSKAYPDLSDPATLGCLVYLVREAWNNPTVTTARSHPFSGGPPWVVGISMRAFSGQTEAEALIVALEEAR